jgi:hypothetical protein
MPRPRAFFVLVLNCPAMFPVADSPVFSEIKYNHFHK